MAHAKSLLLLALGLLFLGAMLPVAAAPRASEPYCVFVPLISRPLPPTPTNTPRPYPTATATPTPQPSLTPTSPGGIGTVYITASGEKYHAWGCRYLRNGATAVSCAWAISHGYTPCSICNPSCP